MRFIGDIMVIIGSIALAYHGLTLSRVSSDLDIMVSSTPLGDVDYIVIPQHIIGMIPHVCGFATPAAVFTIKCSHLGWDIKWQKHKNDVLYLEAKGCKLIPELYDALVQYWRETNGNKPYLSLYKKSNDFFNDYVDYVYDHDYLHKLVAYPNEPVYTLCLKDNEDVAIDKDKFFGLSFDQQLRMFKEEISVIAAERWLIPKKVCGKYHWIQAYSFALHKTVVALTKNWATDFLIKHIDYFAKPEYAYFEHLFKTIKEGEKIMGKKLTNKQAEQIRDEILHAYNTQEPAPRWSIDEGDFGWSEFTDLWEDFGDYEYIESDGGEGEGDYACFVFKWKGQIYKAEYSYQSYNGFCYDDLELSEVEAKEKTVIVYE